MKCQIPYNYIYDEKIIELIYKNPEYIDSIYFGFERGCRTIENYNNCFYEHLNKLRKIKEDTGIKLAYVLNSVIDLEISKDDLSILDSGCVDIVIIARDSIFKQVYERYEDMYLYEVSRFYFLIKENNNEMLDFAKSIAFGFDKEVKTYYSDLEKEKRKLNIIYIVNENCYVDCKYKLVHNANQIYRNLGSDIQKFNCPYLDKRYFYTEHMILETCKKYDIDIFKVCDRAFNDERLYIEMSKWIDVAKRMNKLENQINDKIQFSYLET